MKCKSKIYEDGERTLCTMCAKAQKCSVVKTCFGCRRVEGVYYDKRSDLFLCNRCLYEMEGKT